MAILDARYLPFIEILTELGMDWLASDRIEGIPRGNEPLEDEHALAQARELTGHTASRGVHP